MKEGVTVAHIFRTHHCSEQTFAELLTGYQTESIFGNPGGKINWHITFVICI